MTSPPGPRRWIKHFTTATACQAAAAHHWWLTGLGAPVPRLHSVGTNRLEFEHVLGRHARPHDLPHLAGLLGRLHSNAYTSDLRHARLDRPHTIKSGITIPDFLTPRRGALTKMINSGTIPHSTLTARQVIEVLESATGSPASLYKDSNPRNFLIGSTRGRARCVLVDFDVLTLAPPGYDLAKLTVTLTMTHGALSTTTVDQALIDYNAALTNSPSDLEPVTRTQFMAWADIHQILTSQYLGRGGYQYTWTEHQPR